MSSVGTYNFKRKGKFIIENSIIKGTEVPCRISHSNYGEFILERMRAHPTFMGQVDGLTGREVTFAEMADKSVKCAMWLKKQNVQLGDIIGICTHNQVDMYVPCFASLYVGVTYNAWWDIGLTKAMAKHFVTLTKPKILFVNEELVNVALDAAKAADIKVKIVIFGKIPGFTSLDDILNAQNSEIEQEFRCTQLPSLEHPAAILYTSGSTGLPKGVVHTHKSIFENITENEALDDADHYETTLTFSSLSWLGGMIAMFQGAIRPEKRVIYPTYNDETVFQLIEKFKVSRLLLVSTAAFSIPKSLAKAKYDLSSLKKIITGGAVISEDRQRALADAFPHATVTQAYGSTELGNIGIEQEYKYKPGSCGTVMENIQLKVIDPATGKILGPNEPGENCWKSPFMMVGYYKNPEATVATIDSEGWLHSGDLIKYDEEGNIFFIDRIKEMIKYRTNHVSPGMIEQVLLSHPEVVGAAVFGVPHDLDGEHPIAFVVKTPNSTVLEEDLETLVANVLPDYMKLRAGIKFLEKLPHTASGKVARPALRTLAKSYASS